MVVYAARFAQYLETMIARNGATINPRIQPTIGMIPQMNPMTAATTAITKTAKMY